MNFKSMIPWLITIIILALILRFAGFVFVAALRFWYITIPIILYIIFRSNRKKETEKNPDNVEDAEFEIMNEDEEK